MHCETMLFFYLRCVDFLRDISSGELIALNKHPLCSVLVLVYEFQLEMICLRILVLFMQIMLSVQHFGHWTFSVIVM